MLIPDSKFKEKVLEEIAEEMCLAARTAPKTRGQDLIITAVAKKDTIAKISDEMRRIWVEKGIQSFNRDAENVKKATVMVLIGSKTQTMSLSVCGFCGYPTCVEKDKTPATCAFNALDFGIAVGSAVSIAADRRIDNRLMYTVGRATLNLDLLGKGAKMALGVPLSATGKNPFFDRK